MAERLAVSRLAMEAAGPQDAADSERAGLPTRILAFLLDSVVLFAFTMLFAALAGLNMYLRSHGGEQGITDTDQWTSIGIFLAAMPAWVLLLFAMGSKRGQTPGQYVLGLKAVPEDGARLGAKRLLGYLLALHPLVFHPMFGAGWVLLAWAALLSEPVFVVSLALALLCFVAPLAGLVFAALDSHRRTIHDRLTGIKVIALE